MGRSDVSTRSQHVWARLEINDDVSSKQQQLPSIGSIKISRKTGRHTRQHCMTLLMMSAFK
jgi:hypothetical protein